MKKQSQRKLSLNRETLQSLNSDALEGVAGGATPAIVIGVSVGVSLFFCAPRQAR
jgi:hypothetical protein